MSSKSTAIAACVMVFGALLCGTGCNTTLGPKLGILGYPIPMSPYFQKPVIFKNPTDIFTRENSQFTQQLSPLG